MREGDDACHLRAGLAIWLNRQVRRGPLTSWGKWAPRTTGTRHMTHSNHTHTGYFFDMVFMLANTYLHGYTHQQIGSPPAYTVNRTEEFDTWLARLTDLRARAKILVRIRRAERGHFGDVKLLEDGVSAMRIDWGPGYRVYFAREGRVMYLLLCGGDKSTQAADIKHAKTMWSAIREELS